jgi:hypothetical protein
MGGPFKPFPNLIKEKKINKRLGRLYLSWSTFFVQHFNFNFFLKKNKNKTRIITLKLLTSWAHVKLLTSMYILFLAIINR